MAHIVIMKPPRLVGLDPNMKAAMDYMWKLAFQLQQLADEFEVAAAALPAGYNPALLTNPNVATIATAQSTANAAYTLAAAAQTAATAAQTTANTATTAAAAAQTTATAATTKLAAIAAVTPYSGSITNPVTGAEGTSINSVPTAIIAAAA